MKTDRRLQINQERGSTIRPDLWSEAKSILEQLEKDGYFPMVVTAYRSLEYQAALYAQGRESLEEVNRLREIAGLDPLTEKENENEVTKAKPGKSLHQSRRAIDIVNYPDGVPLPEWKNMDFYRKAWSYFEPLGWKWGHHFKSIDDIPHFEK